MSEKEFVGQGVGVQMTEFVVEELLILTDRAEAVAHFLRDGVVVEQNALVAAFFFEREAVDREDLLGIVGRRVERARVLLLGIIHMQRERQTRPTE